MQKANPSLIFSLLFSLLLASYVQHRVFFDPTAINDDVRNQIYWMYRLIDPKLYPNDFIASYFTQYGLVSPVVKALYWLASHFIDPLRFSQFLPFGLIMFSTLFLFKATEAYKGARYAFWISFAFNVYVWMITNLAGGIPRSFFYPLLFLFLWFFVTKRWWLVVFCFCLQVLIYPATFFLSVGLLFVELFLDRKTTPVKQTQIFCIVLGIVSSLIILTGRYVIVPPHDFGHLITREEALLMPEFYADGRVKVFPFSYELVQNGITFRDLFNLNSKIFTQKTIAYIAIVSLLFIFVPIIIGYKKFLEPRYGPILIPRYIWSLTGVSIALCILAFIFLFYLYLPNKYIFYTLPLVVMFLVGVIFYKIEVCYSYGRYFVWILATFLLIGVSPLWKNNLIQISAKKKAVYNYLRNLPDDSIIAAPLKLADNIPAFSRKAVFVSDEANIPFHKNYYKEIKSRIGDLTKAYYSTDLEQIEKFVQKNKIDYILIDKKDLRFQSGSNMLRLPSSCKVFQIDQYVVVSARKLFNDKLIK